MRTIVHISDLHFGRVDPATVEPLTAAIRRLTPDVVIVSGDLTQRARSEEFRAARTFLNALPGPQIVVPGNHDVPLYNLVARVFAPLRGFKKYIAFDPEPAYTDEELVVQGLNTTRSSTWKNGRLNGEQLEKVRAAFQRAPAAAVRVLVTHHPLDLPENHSHHDLVGRAARAMPILAACGADVLLAGHFHRAHSGDTSQRYDIRQFAALVVQAGTTTSTRLREEPNSFNLLKTSTDEITVDRYLWRPSERLFASQLTERFRRTPDGWRRAALEGAPAAENVVVGKQPK